MISFCSPNLDSDLMAQFRSWVEAEWGKVDPFEGQNGKVLPAPILAVKDGALVGGLSFTHSSIPGAQDIALWINTLLVAPGLRRMGIGSELISAAENSVDLAGVDELYVFTDVAGLYQKLGWHIHSSAEKGTILKKEIAHGRDRT